jgi:mono/diheme cytochrome c family protein
VRRRFFSVALLAVCAACANEPLETAPLAATIASPALEPGVELPPGPGRQILLNRCLGCHDLGGLDLFKGFYTRDSWRDLVISMIGNGAELDAAEIEAVSDYLGQHFGPG